MQSAKGTAADRIADLRLRNADLNLTAKRATKTRSIVPSIPKFEIRNPKLFDHFIRSRQHIRRYCQTDLLRCFQINYKFELLRLLDRKVGGLGAFEDLVHISCSPAV